MSIVVWCWRMNEIKVVFFPKMKNQTGEASFRESSSFDWLIFLSFNSLFTCLIKVRIHQPINSSLSRAKHNKEMKYNNTYRPRQTFVTVSLSGANIYKERYLCNKNTTLPSHKTSIAGFINRSRGLTGVSRGAARLARWRTLSREQKERLDLNVCRTLSAILASFSTVEMKTMRSQLWAEMARVGVSLVRSSEVNSSCTVEIA